ncbi:hypothetical protein TEA_011489 [Camellia sinensis var. sinensis]|uniref:Histone deacetylase complex subunit SAP18 n=1 Tax=Camellia sinensis var. sinensis TaxID=542762 RepID=A0A4S4CXX3_CAMSN|nr:hypothetical protein TEA_011489 [Camellia sinensis var. sinensis]
MAGVGEAQRRQGRPLPPARRGPPGPPPPLSKAAPRFEPVDREKGFGLIFFIFFGWSSLWWRRGLEKEIWGCRMSQGMRGKVAEIGLMIIATRVRSRGERKRERSRDRICPLLLRVFTKIGGHHSDADFAVRGKEPKDEVQIYTWKDATLRELTDLVKEVAPEARRRDAVLSFAFVYPDKHGRFVVKEVGRTYSYPNGRRPDSGGKALGELSFQIGDYLDVAIL